MAKGNALGLRELTDAELGYLRTSRNYGGAIILAFIKMNRDAAALDCNDASEAEKLVEKIRGATSRAGIRRQIQAFNQGKVLIISRPPGSEKLVLTPEQEEKFL